MKKCTKDINAALDRIRDKLARAGKSLNPPAAEDEVVEFEEEFAIQLPPDYRAFIVQLGDGGDGPDMGLRPLWESAFDPIEFVRLPGDLFAESSRIPTDFIRVHDSGAARASDPKEEIRGWVTLCEDGAGIVKALCVHGRDYGRVLRVEGDNCDVFLSYFDDFLGWYEAWLDDTLCGWRTDYHGSYMPGDEAHLIGMATSKADDQIRLAAIHSLDRRVPVLAEATLTALCGLIRDDPVREIRDRAMQAVRQRVPEKNTSFWSTLLPSARR